MDCRELQALLLLTTVLTFPPSCGGTNRPSVDAWTVDVAPADGVEKDEASTDGPPRFAPDSTPASGDFATAADGEGRGGDLAESGDSMDGPCGPDEDTLDISLLLAALDWIAGGAAPIDSFIVSHCGEILVESYYHGYDLDTLHELQSATKTFSAVLIGIAIDQGIVAGVEQPLSELLPAYDDLLTDGKEDITLEHLLTMTSGLRWVDFGVGSSFERIAAAEDSVALILGEPLDAAPGETFFYNTGSSHLLSAIIHYNSGMTTAAYADEYLLGPLGITDYEWPALQDGIQQGGWGMTMRPRDFLELGRLLLDEGTWGGEQIVSQDFVDAATAYQVSNGSGGGYGYQMWIDTNIFAVDDIAGARGYGGQDCFVLEALDMVVVFTGSILHPAQMALSVEIVMNDFVIPSHPD